MVSKFEISETEGSDLSEDPYRVAEELGFVVRLPQANELFIDIDSTDGMKQFHATLRVLEKNGFICQWQSEPSFTPNHYHIVVTLPFEVSPTERILLQAVLGSDPKREVLSWMRIHYNLERPPTVFFEQSEEAA